MRVSPNETEAIKIGARPREERIAPLLLLPAKPPEEVLLPDEGVEELPEIVEFAVVLLANGEIEGAPVAVVLLLVLLVVLLGVALTSTPSPQGIAPVDCVWFGGGTEVPEGSVIVKRVVHLSSVTEPFG